MRLTTTTISPSASLISSLTSEGGSSSNTWAERSPGLLNVREQIFERGGELHAAGRSRLKARDERAAPAAPHHEAVVHEPADGGTDGDPARPDSRQRSSSDGSSSPDL
jgi:hypothetical protein